MIIIIRDNERLVHPLYPTQCASRHFYIPTRCQIHAVDINIRHINPHAIGHLVIIHHHNVLCNNMCIDKKGHALPRAPYTIAMQWYMVSREGM